MGLGTKSLRCPNLRLHCFFFPILRRCSGLQRPQEATRNLRHFFDRRKEGSFVSLRGLVESADFAHELQGSRSNLLLSHRRIEIKKFLDVSAHSITPA